ncbi:MAG: hypothetical protein LQ342_001258 [Letrouitia transgressa]|nr:MAG: hypothetical protein LQ342_001258 [Letrouitia transgressa]
MVASILYPHSIAPAVTGCVKDLHRLWGLDDVQLLGNFKDERAAGVASVKHGNSFPLQNQTVLQLAGVFRGSIDTTGMVVPYDPSMGKGLRTWRETFVSLCFVLPHEAESKEFRGADRDGSLHGNLERRDRGDTNGVLLVIGLNTGGIAFPRTADYSESERDIKISQ